MGAPDRATESHSEFTLCGAAIVEFDEIAQGDGEIYPLGRVERIDVEGILQGRDDNGEAQGIKSALDERQFIRQRRQSAPLIGRDRSKDGQNRIPDRHCIHALARPLWQPMVSIA